MTRYTLPHMGASEKLVIILSPEYPPIPTTAFDWQAYIDGHEEDGPYGSGPTPSEALAALVEKLADSLDEYTGTIDRNQGATGSGPAKPSP